VALFWVCFGFVFSVKLLIPRNMVALFAPFCPFFSALTPSEENWAIEARLHLLFTILHSLFATRSSHENPLASPCLPNSLLGKNIASALEAEKRSPRSSN
jgi:hypothetical protein